MLAIYGALFAACLLSSTLVPLAAEGVLVGLIVMGRVEPVPAVLVATGGNVGGALVNYALGRLGRVAASRVRPDLLARAEHLLLRFGGVALALSWLPIVGDPLTLAAGVARIGLPRFLVWTAIGRLGRNALIALVALRAADLLRAGGQP